MARRSASPALLPLLRSETQAGLLERLILHPDDAYVTFRALEGETVRRRDLWRRRTILRPEDPVDRIRFETTRTDRHQRSDE